MTYSQDITIKAKHYLGGHCNHCGTRKSLEFAHIYFDGYLDVNINGRRLSGRSLIQKHLKFDTLQDRIMLLCTKCHRHYDTITMSELARESLLKKHYIEQYKRIIED